MSGEWGIWRSHTSIDEFGKRHMVGEWVLRDAESYGYLTFDSEPAARSAAGIYNNMDAWTYEARRFDA